MLSNEPFPRPAEPQTAKVTPRAPSTFWFGPKQRWLWLAAALAAGIRTFFWLRTGVVFEDALISLRYAENLAAGRGLVYNAGERVFGASTPLYVLFLAVLSFLHAPALALARVAAIGADAVTLRLWCRWLLRRFPSPLPAVGWALFFALSPVLVEVGVSGMETSFALLLLTLALLGDLEERPVQHGAALGLLILVRPDGLLAAGVLLGCRWLRTRRAPWRSAALAAGVVLPWALFAALYFGSPIPHSIPAKVAAYNLHRHDPLVNLRGAMGELAPIDWPPARWLFTLVLLPLWAAGLRAAWRDPRLRPLGVLFVAWWLYLVVPRTVLFTWYYPLLLLPAYVLAAIGIAEWSRLSSARLALPAALGVAAAALLVHGHFVLARRGLLQHEEWRVRRGAGLWLRDHTPASARIALEPIGYMGYYSGRRVLDEVGLVSPEMVPLNRKGDGWFAEMIRRFQPDFVVERPVYLLRNATLLSGVKLFGSPDEREEFAVEYAPVTRFESDSPLPGHLAEDYRFVIFRRRSPAASTAARRRIAALPPAARAERVAREIDGMELIRPEAGAAPPPPR